MDLMGMIFTIGCPQGSLSLWKQRVWHPLVTGTCGVVSVAGLGWGKKTLGNSLKNGRSLTILVKIDGATHKRCGKQDTGPWQSMINHYMGVAITIDPFQGGIPQKADVAHFRGLNLGDSWGTHQKIVQGNPYISPEKSGYFWVIIPKNP